VLVACLDLNYVVLLEGEIDLLGDMGARLPATAKLAEFSGSEGKQCLEWYFAI